MPTLRPKSNAAGPFAEILWPVAKDGFSGVKLHDAVRHGFQSYLSARLSEVLSQCLYLHFSAYRLSRSIFRGTSRGCYATFVRETNQAGLDSLLDCHPVALEAIHLLTAQARRFAEDFSAHLRQDRAILAACRDLPRDRDPGSVNVGHSDSHHGGRSVIRIRFSDGRTVFYKPRSLDAEFEWADGLRRLNRHLALPLKASPDIPCGDHGWMEAVPEITNMSQRNADAFFWRYGATLCLAWLLDAADFHRENFVTSRSAPVLIDAEGLMHPIREGEKRSLVRTGIVPGKNGRLDASGLGMVQTQIVASEVAWTHLGSDDLTQILAPSALPPASHLPRVKGRTILPRDQAQNIIHGFRATAGAATRNKPLIDDWRKKVADVARRKFIRPTITYAALLEELARPANLESRSAWRKALRSLPGGSHDAGTLEEERAQLARWDVPHFPAPRGNADPAAWAQLADCEAELATALSGQPAPVRQPYGSRY